MHEFLIQGVNPIYYNQPLRDMVVTKIKEIKLRPSVQPEGIARIIIYAGLNPNPTKIIWQTSPTIQLTNTTVIVPNLPLKITQASFRYIKIETVSIDSPTGSSWVAWRDIEIIGTSQELKLRKSLLPRLFDYLFIAVQIVE